jgi:hypothetical protein
MAVTEVFQTVLYTNFPERAQKLADEILNNNPKVIGLQEVSTYLIQTPGDFLYGNPQPATTMVMDFLTILLMELEARGLSYTVAAVNENADIEVPMFSGETANGAPVLSDLRMIDSDVILVRNDIDYSNVTEGNYTYNVGMDLGGVYVEFTRGYSAVDIDLGETSYRFVNTHLEVGSNASFALVQALQMQELLAILSMEEKPIILVGDLNSSPEDPATQPYSQALAAGFVDAWLDHNAEGTGYTCCFDEYVSDPTAELYMRIDHVLVLPNGRSLRGMNAWTVGDDYFVDATPTGLWPSDHAGVVAHIHFR